MQPNFDINVMRKNDNDPKNPTNGEVIPMRGTFFQFLFISFLTPASVLPYRLPFMYLTNSNCSAKKSFTPTSSPSQGAPLKKSPLEKTSAVVLYLAMNRVREILGSKELQS